MQFTAHSPEALLTKALREYCEEKLQRPILRHKLDHEAGTMSAEFEQSGESVALKVRVSIPGTDPFTVHGSHEDAYASIDLTADKLERRVRDIADKRLAKRRHIPAPVAVSATDEARAEEEQVLRAMGALDAVLDV